MTDDELKRLFESMRQENAEAHSDTRRHFDVLTEGTRRHFEVLTEATRQEIRLVAESVAGVNEKLDRETGDIPGEMRRGFAETQAMIKFSHVEIDRRMRSLEDAVADLQARVERLESSTH